MADAAMNHRACTHDARLEGDVKCGFQQAIILQYQPTLAQCHNFRMRCRIVSTNRSVPAFANHLVVMHQHRTNRNFTFFPRTTCKGQRMTHPVFVGKFTF